jgi:hypothetical protein
MSSKTRGGERLLRLAAVILVAGLDLPPNRPRFIKVKL